MVSVETISRKFIYLPSNPLALSVHYWEEHNSKTASLYFLELIVFASLLTAIGWKSADLFLPLWQKLQEGAPMVKNGTTRQKTKSYLFPSGPLKALFSKEMIISARNSKNILWFSFLFFIWLIQAGLNSVLSHNIRNYQIDANFNSSLVQAFQFITSVFFVTAFTLRFVFPAFSSERKTLWILGSAPLNQKKIFLAKFAFYSLFFCLIGLLIGCLNIAGLPLTVSYVGLTLLLFITAILFIVAFGLSLGALFPNLETDDPGVISTSLSGLTFMTLSLVYGACGGLMIFIALNKHSLIQLLIFCAGSLLAVFFLVYLTPKYLRNKDLIRSTLS
jgi:ABC-2 type transport system permease protein